jgi:hypothetical protein
VISSDSEIFSGLRFTEQLGPLAICDALKLSSIEVIVASDPQAGHFGCFGGFLIRKKEH